MFGLHKETTKAAAERTTAESGATYLPAVDVAETEAGYTIYADVPGADKDSVNVTYEDGIVTLKAQAIAAKEDETVHAIHREFRVASYERAFRVSEDVDVEQISAEMSNGVLKVSLPRKASNKKVINVAAK